MGISESSEQLSKQWENEGYLLLRKLLDASLVEDLRTVFGRVTDRMLREFKDEGLIDDLKAHLPLERRFSEAAGKHANRFGRSWRREVATPELFELQRAEPLVDVVGLITGTDVIGHPVFNARPKLPGQQLTVVPWHQDSSYFGPESQHSLILTCWIPLVPVDEANGCLQIVPGSHRTGFRKHRREDREGQFLEIPQDDVDEACLVNCLMQPGDVLVFHNLTMHRSLPSTSATIRWSVDIRYIRDGDGLGKIGWSDSSFKWVIRSKTQPITTYPQWHEQLG